MITIRVMVSSPLNILYFWSKIFFLEEKFLDILSILDSDSSTINIAVFIIAHMLLWMGFGVDFFNKLVD